LTNGGVHAVFVTGGLSISQKYFTDEI
jgi:hypothetical protein